MEQQTGAQHADESVVGARFTLRGFNFAGSKAVSRCACMRMVKRTTQGWLLGRTLRLSGSHSDSCREGGGLYDCNALVLPLVPVPPTWQDILNAHNI